MMVREYVIPGAGVLSVVGAGELVGVGWSYCRDAYPEVGARRRPIVSAARALARSRAARGLARVARGAAESTRAGRAALGVVDAARRIARREGQRAAELAQADPSALLPVALSDAQRLGLVRAFLSSRLPPYQLQQALRMVV